MPRQVFFNYGKCTNGGFIMSCYTPLKNGVFFLGSDHFPKLGFANFSGSELFKLWEGSVRRPAWKPGETGAPWGSRSGTAKMADFGLSGIAKNKALVGFLQPRLLEVFFWGLGCVDFWGYTVKGMNDFLVGSWLCNGISMGWASGKGKGPSAMGFLSWGYLDTCWPSKMQIWAAS